MNIQQLFYATQIMKFGSFNKTAKELFISQPSLSKAIKDLETEVGINIFTRSSKGVHLTLEGEKFLHYAESIVSQFEQIKSIKFRKNYSVSSFALSSVSSSFVASAFVKLCISQNNDGMLRFSIKFTETQQIVDDLSQNLCDLGVIFIGDVHKDLWLNIFDSKGIEYCQLGESPLSLLISRNDVLANKGIVTLDDIKEYIYVHINPIENEGIEFSYLDYFNLLHNSTHKKAVLTYDREIAYQLISKTKAFTFAFNNHKDYSSKYNLTCIPLQGSTVSCEIGYICKVNTELSPFSKIFIGLLKEELSTRRCVVP